ncbi:GntR family transcriptional regulator [Lacticaseibacillus rhamnosus]
MRTGRSEFALGLDRGSVVPVYRQIYERLRGQILSGALTEGKRLPPERELAASAAVRALPRATVAFVVCERHGCNAGGRG